MMMISTRDLVVGCSISKVLVANKPWEVRPVHVKNNKILAGIVAILPYLMENSKSVPGIMQIIAVHRTSYGIIMQKGPYLHIQDGKEVLALNVFQCLLDKKYNVMSKRLVRIDFSLESIRLTV
jgi:hypothetical protein